MLKTPRPAARRLNNYALGIRSKHVAHKGCIHAKTTRSVRISFSSPHTQHVATAEPFSGAAKHCLGSPTISLHIGHSFFAAGLVGLSVRLGSGPRVEGLIVVVKTRVCIPLLPSCLVWWLSPLGRSRDSIEFENARCIRNSATGAALSRKENAG